MPYACTDVAASDFNNFFCNIAESTLAVPSVNCNPEIYLHRQTLPLPRGGFSFGEVSFIQVREAIDKLKNKHSKDIYGLSVSVLKQIKNNLIIPLTRLFNFCISEGIYPDAFKVSRVIPVFKKGYPRDVNNYRPISLIPAVSKIFELLLKDQLINYMEQHNLLNDFQYGFRRGRSTALAVMGLLEYVVGGFEEGMHVGATLCDLSKAFDCISHDVLLAKLVYYGLDNTSIAEGTI